mgnify:CR=1 FL=1
MSRIDAGLQEKAHGNNRSSKHAGAVSVWELLVPRRLSFLSKTLFFSGGLFFA